MSQINPLAAALAGLTQGLVERKRLKKADQRYDEQRALEAERWNQQNLLPAGFSDAIRQQAAARGITLPDTGPLPTWALRFYNPDPELSEQERKNQLARLGIEGADLEFMGTPEYREAHRRFMLGTQKAGAAKTDVELAQAGRELSPEADAYYRSIYRTGTQENQARFFQALAASSPEAQQAMALEWLTRGKQAGAQGMAADEFVSEPFTRARRTGADAQTEQNLTSAMLAGEERMQEAINLRNSARLAGISQNQTGQMLADEQRQPGAVDTRKAELDLRAAQARTGMLQSELGGLQVGEALKPYTNPDYMSPQKWVLGQFGDALRAQGGLTGSQRMNAVSYVNEAAQKYGWGPNEVAQALNLINTTGAPQEYPFSIGGQTIPLGGPDFINATMGSMRGVGGGGGGSRGGGSGRSGSGDDIQPDPNAPPTGKEVSSMMTELKKYDDYITYETDDDGNRTGRWTVKADAPSAIRTRINEIEKRLTGESMTRKERIDHAVGIWQPKRGSGDVASITSSLVIDKGMDKRDTVEVLKRIHAVLPGRVQNWTNGAYRFRGKGMLSPTEPHPTAKAVEFAYQMYAEAAAQGKRGDDADKYVVFMLRTRFLGIKDK